MSKIILHIDINAFFANAELLRHPELNNKPIAIGGPLRRGVISTSSYEARKYGVKSGMPIYMAKKLCPSITILPGDYNYYQDLSNKFFAFIKNNISPIIEIASIDECYVDVTNAMKNIKDPINYLKKLQLDLKNEIGLGCSIGLSTTKFLAKMGSDYKKPMGITIIRKKDIAKILYPLPIGDMFGIGKKTTIKLKKIGVNTIKDLAIRDDEELRKVLGKMFFVFKDLLKGKGDDNVTNELFDPKSISTSSTFSYDTASYEEISLVIKNHSKNISKELKSKNMIATTIHITIRDSDFKTITRSKTLNKIIESEDDIYFSAMELFDANWNGYEVRLIGVGVSSLYLKEKYFSQMNLFDIEKDNEECKTRLLINDLNRKVDKELFMTLKDYKIKKEDE